MSEVESRVPIGLDGETSRRNFLKTAAWTGAALSAMGIGGFGVAVRRAEAEGEYKTYEGLGDAAIFKDAFLDQIVAIRDHEMAHADALATTLGQLGAEVPATPQFTFPGGTFGDAATFLELAATFEPVGIGAYQGAAPALKSKDILAAAISIHNAECQHRCAINILNLVNPPNELAFEEALPLQKVQAAVKPFGITG
jgi:hypothetical protein